MHRLTRMKEFVYELENEFYQIGMCACKKLDSNDQLVTLYKEYKLACDYLSLEKYHTYDLTKLERDEIANKFECVLNEAHIPIEKRNFAEEDRQLFDFLIQSYSVEIDRQIELWLKADRCLFEKQVDGLKNK